MSWYSALIASRPFASDWASVAGANAGVGSRKTQSAAAARSFKGLSTDETCSIVACPCGSGRDRVQEEDGGGHQVQRQQQDAFQPVRFTIQGDVRRDGGTQRQDEELERLEDQGHRLGDDQARKDQDRRDKQRDLRRR